MELLHERCAALDIGKKDLKACVRTPSPKGKRSRRQEIRTFATTTNALLELARVLKNTYPIAVLKESEKP